MSQNPTQEEPSATRRNPRRRASVTAKKDEDAGELETDPKKKEKKGTGRKRRKEENEDEDVGGDGANASGEDNPEEIVSSTEKVARTAKKGAKAKDSSTGTGKQTKPLKRSKKATVTKLKEDEGEDEGEGENEDMADADVGDGEIDKDTQDEDDEDEDDTFVPKTTKPTVVRAKRASKAKKETKATKKAATSKKQSAPRKKREKKPDHQRVTDRDELPKLWNVEEAREKDGSYTFKIISWNVAGLRAMLRNSPTALADLVSEQRPDVLCLQETKLQESHLDDPKQHKEPLLRFLLSKQGYDAYYNCSTAKKGYSGTAVFLKRRRGTREPPPPPPQPQPVAKAEETGEDDGDKGEKGDGEKEDENPDGKKQAKLANFFTKDEKPKRRSSRSKKAEETKDDAVVEEEQEKFVMEQDTAEVDVDELIPQVVSYVIGKEEHDTEGRVITLEFPLFTMSNVYVPNSGQELARLTYRTEQWDGDLVDFMKRKQADRKLPVLWTGDLNVAHTFRDVWNDGAKHLAKQAGTTPQERSSFDRQLGEGFVDAFRRLHPEAMGQYTYWSMRAGNREPNKGLRLDYFIGSEDLFEARLFPASGEGAGSGEGAQAEGATAAKNEGADGQGAKPAESEGAGGEGATSTQNERAGLDSATAKEKREQLNTSPHPTGRVQVRDSYMLYEQKGSDHCPVVLELQIRKQ